MSQAMPIFGQFMNSKGLKVLIDNLEIHGEEKLKELADSFMQEMAEQQKQQAQMQQEQMQNNPMVIKAKTEQAKVQLEAQQNQVENQIKGAEIAIEKQQADTDFLRVLNEMHSAKAQMIATQMKAHAEETRAAVDLAIKHADMKHSHGMDHKEHSLSIAQLQHEMEQAKKETKSESVSE